MNNGEDNIDDQIRKALEAEGKTLAGAVGEQQSIFDLIGRSFQGRMKSLIAISWLAMFAVFGFAIFCAFKLFGASDISTKINWGVGVIVAVQFLAVSRSLLAAAIWASVMTSPTVCKTGPALGYPALSDSESQ